MSTNSSVANSLGDHALKNFLDVSLLVGTGERPERDFALAVHMTLRWAQERGNGPICATLPLSQELEQAIRTGLPLEGLAGWPPPDDDLGLGKLPADVPPTVVNSRRAVTWKLTPTTLHLVLETQSREDMLRVEVDIRVERSVRLREQLWKRGANFVPGAPGNLRMISSACDGLYDGEWHILPEPMPIETAEDAEEFVELVNSSGRSLPVALFGISQEAPDVVTRMASKFSLDAFPAVHVAAASGGGFDALQDLLAEHRPAYGQMRIYRADYSDFDLPSTHPSVSLFNQSGAPISLETWRARLLRSDVPK